MVVRYAASPVLLADGETITLEMSALLGEKAMKGSLTSLEGEVIGEEMPEGIAFEWLVWRAEDWRVDLPEVGDARRERVLRKVDLRFAGGDGRVDALIGRVGSLAPG